MSNPETIDMLVDRVSVIKCHECHSEVEVSRALPFSVVKCPECGADLPVPALLGNFVLFKTIGKGAMGAVYQGFDQTLKRHVAIKVILQSLGDDKGFVDNFIREAQALAALNHVNVVQIYSCGKEKGQPYIVMELVTGERLDEMMAESGPMNEQRVLEIAMDVANGLKAAHEIGLIHGDIKPQNILLDQKGRAKVVDFGLARSAAEETETAEIWGTPYYIAPEKARRQKEDHRADIYCLGATLFHAFAGRPPFEGETAKDVVVKRLQEKAPNLQDIRPELNDETAHLISRMLEADPFRRYPTYDSMQADLNSALQASRRGPRQAEAVKKKGGAGKWIALLGGVIAIAAALWFFVLNKPVEPEPETPKGKTVMKLINGKLVPVFVPDPEPGSEEAEESAPEDVGAEGTEKTADRSLKGFTEVILSARDGKGADASISSLRRKINFGQEQELLVNHTPSPGRKAYIRFDCTVLNLFKCKQPMLKLTVVSDLEIPDGQSIKVFLYGIHDSGPTLWGEGTGGQNTGFTGPVTWNNAPANMVTHPHKMLEKQVTLLQTLTLTQSVKAGEVLKFAEEGEDETFLEFIQEDQDKIITFVVTVNESDKLGSLAFASREHPEVSAPELSIFTPTK